MMAVVKLNLRPFKGAVCEPAGWKSTGGDARAYIEGLDQERAPVSETKLICYSGDRTQRVGRKQFP